jgi:hypothetical protein
MLSTSAERERAFTGAMPWIITALGPVLLLGPMLARGQALFWGTTMLQFVPWRSYALRLLSDGHLPLWNPLLGMGAPLLANYQVAVLYPPNWLLALVGPAWGLGLLAMIHLIWAGWGMIALARRLGLGPLAQAVSGLAFALSGYLTARLGFPTITAAAAWVPWVIVAADGLAESCTTPLSARRLSRAVMALALAFALQWLAGHAQTSWYTLALCSGWMAVRGFALGRAGGLARSWIALVSAGVIGVGLSAAQLLPTAEYLLQSGRQTGLDSDLALTYSFWPWRILGLLLPNLFGSPAHADYWGYGNYWEDAIYIGTLPCVLAVGVVLRAIAAKGSRVRLAWGMGLLCLVALLLALGKNTPIFPFLFRHVPSFSLFQAPTRWNLLLVFGLSLLAGIGAHEWQPPSGRSLYWTRLGTAGALGVSAFALLSRSLLPDVQPTLAPAFVWAGLFLAGCGVLGLIQHRSPNFTWMMLVGVFLLVDLVSAANGLNPSIEASLYRGRASLAGSPQVGQRVYMDPALEYELKFERFFRFDRFETVPDWRAVRDSGLPNLTLLDGQPSANNFDPLQPARYAFWMETLAAATGAERDGMLARMAIGAVAVSSADQLAGVAYEPVESVPRARMVAEAIWVADGEQALAAVLGREFDPDRMVVLEGVPPSEPQGRVRTGEVTLLPLDDPNRVDLTATSAEGGWLVLADTWYPGWRATVDGQPVPLYRADYLFRAVEVPPGDHRVTFAYAPLSLRLGAVISGLAWLLLGVARWLAGRS